MKKYLVAIGLAISLGSTAHAASAIKSKPVKLWQCQDYLGLDESSRPIALGVFEAANHKGKAADAVIDVDELVTVSPTLVNVCNENPQRMLKDALATIHSEKPAKK